jgi:hypothetical protein
VRLTVHEFHQLLDGALWREERFRELLAWHAMHVMAGAGAKTRGGGPIHMEALLGRAPIPGPHYQPLAPEPEPAAPSEATPSAPTPSRQSIDPIRARLEQLVERGMATRVQ